MEWYCVDFKLYHYGRGTYTESIKRDSYDEAVSVKSKIDKLFNLKDSLSEDDPDRMWVVDLIGDITECGGFLKSSAEIYKITKTKI